MKKLEEKSLLCGTSFHGVVITSTREKLTEIFGFTPEGPSGDGKCQSEWNLETPYGVFSVYDWKEYREFSDNENIEWHIGGKSGSLEERFKEEILEKINEI